MSELLLHLKMVFGNHFGSALFLLIVATIASGFIGYLLVDYFRSLAAALRIKRRHREERRARRSS